MELSTREIVAGVVIAVLGYLSGSLADVFFRYSHEIAREQVACGDEDRVADLSIRSETTASSHKSTTSKLLGYPIVPTRPKCDIGGQPLPAWIAAIVLTCVFQPALISIGLSLAPATVIVSLSAVSLSTTIIFAVIFLGEQLALGVLVGSLLIILGFLGTVLAFSSGTHLLPPAEAFRISITEGYGTPFIAFLLLIGLMSLLLFCAKPHHCSNPYYKFVASATARRPLIAQVAAATFTGLVGAMAHISTKITMSTWAESQHTKNLSRFEMFEKLWGWILVLACLATCCVWGASYSLKLGEATVVVPLRNGLNMLAGIVASTVLLFEIPSSTLRLYISLSVMCGGFACMILAQRETQRRMATFVGSDEALPTVIVDTVEMKFN